MRLNKEKAEIFIPNALNIEDALSRTTKLCIAAHHDDIEIMAASAIVDCYECDTQHFCGVVVADGGGSPRNGAYQNYTDEQMKVVRADEQKKASVIGKYTAQLMLCYPSTEIKDKQNDTVTDELASILLKTSPQEVFTHNLADKHPTHIGVVYHVIKAIRSLPKEKRPKKLYALEVWRGLDWLRDSDKQVFSTTKNQKLQAELLEVFVSQISGGKRYDLAAMGRRLSNATFFESHATDELSSAIYGLDLTPLIEQDNLSIKDYILEFVTRFKEDVTRNFDEM